MEEVKYVLTYTNKTGDLCTTTSTDRVRLEKVVIDLAMLGLDVDGNNIEEVYTNDN